MTTEQHDLADLLHQAYFGEAGSDNAWHGRSLATILRDIDQRFVETPLRVNAHSALEIVLHLAFWDDVCTRRLNGERLSVTTGDPEDWPHTQAGSSSSWSEAVEQLRRAQVRLIDTVRVLPDGAMQAKVPGWPWSNYLMIHGTLHHDLYHAGQLALAPRVLTVAGTAATRPAAGTTFAPAPLKAEISLDVAASVDLRVGTIVDVAPVPDADRLMTLMVDFGDGTKPVIAGIRQERRDPKQLIGRQALFYCNVPRRTIRGRESSAMLCDVGNADGLVPVILEPESPVPNGARAG